MTVNSILSRAYFALWVAASCGLAAPSQSAELTLEAIFSPDEEVRVDFSGSPLQGLLWSPAGGRYLEPRGTGSSFQSPLVREIATGRSEPLFDDEDMARALAGLPGFPEQDARHLPKDEVRLSPLQDAMLVKRANDLFHYSIPGAKARRLTQSSELEEIARFSPDGSLVSFVRDNDLHVVRVEDGRETELTDDGGADRLNGKLDWVYQEEIYGRGDFKGYWWSPDSRSLAFLSLDQSAVPRFTLIDHLTTQSTSEVVHYPKAGDPNPVARLGIVAASGGPIVWIDPSSLGFAEPLIARVGWTPDSERVVMTLQDREQTALAIYQVDRQTGSIRRILRETSPAFVDRELTGEPRFLADGSFLWLSARSGYHHLYHFEATGKVRRQLTDGSWEVRQLYGVDQRARWVYFAASEHSPIEVHIYRVRLDGEGFERLSRDPGTHSAEFDAEFSYYFDTWSDFETPPRIYLHRADGTRVETLDENRVPELEALDLPRVEFLQVPSPDGFVFEAALLKPPDFDPGRSYPVVQHNYGGPHAQTVKNAWGGARAMWLRHLTQQGFIVWMCDNRSASAKGIWPTWKAYKRLGIVELEDLEACLDWLKRKPWIDGTRVALHGGSYGGFMAAFALTRSRSFKAGIAFAPVTDWRLYDTIYTERYMGRPEDNPEGYSTTSVIEAAGQLHGELLLIHGTMDDNVHLQNTLQLVHALQQAEKDFQLMLYPNSRHGVRDQVQIYHLYRLKTRFLRENL